jgi:hypothetical protein
MPDDGLCSSRPKAPMFKGALCKKLKGSWFARVMSLKFSTRGRLACGRDSESKLKEFMCLCVLYSIQLKVDLILYYTFIIYILLLYSFFN